jgi:hypothetical protein
MGAKMQMMRANGMEASRNIDSFSAYSTVTNLLF